MMQGNLALKLGEFEDGCCGLRFVEDCEQNLSKTSAEDAAGNKAEKSITLKLIVGKRK